MKLAALGIPHECDLETSGGGHGFEYSLVLFAGFICIALSGGGDWSFDGRKARHASYAAAGRARLRNRH